MALRPRFAAGKMPGVSFTDPEITRVQAALDDFLELVEEDEFSAFFG